MRQLHLAAMVAVLLACGCRTPVSQHRTEPIAASGSGDLDNGNGEVALGQVVPDSVNNNRSKPTPSPGSTIAWPPRNDSQNSNAPPLSEQALARIPPADEVGTPQGTIRRASYELQPSQEPAEHLIPEVVELPTPASTGVLTIHNFEQMALSNNPAIAQAEGRIQALQGKWLQVGLYPNPIAGYAAEEMGDNGTAGKQGAYVSQQFILGKKLHLNRNVVQQELAQAEADFAAMQQRVRTDVQIAYYSLLLAQRRETIVADLVGIAEKAVQASQNLFKAEEIGKASVLQSQVELNTSLIHLQQAKNARMAAWRRLTSVTGRPDLPLQTVAGNIEDLTPDFEFDVIMQSLMGTSPELASAYAATERARWAHTRAKVEAIPDIKTQIVVQHDNETGDDIAGVQIGIPLPLFDRNQGGVQQAVGQIVEAERNVAKTELRLRNQLAVIYQAYADARIQVEKYGSDILPQAKESLDLIERGYEAGEMDFLSLLTAQRTYSQTNLAYLDALRQLWTRAAEIEGLLLKGSLNTGQ